MPNTLINPVLSKHILSLSIAFLVMLNASDVLMAETTHEALKQQVNLAEHERSQVGKLKQIISSLKGASEQQKLKGINNFFNQHIQYVDDMHLWKKSDYWATPFEAMMKRAGDCEDFAIAKYMLLKALDIPVKKLRLSYVKAVSRSIDGGVKTRAHMVLAYYASHDAEPLILDSVQRQLLPASLRPDLKLVYSFNHDSLWVGDSRQPSAKAQSSLSKWREMLARMRGATKQLLET